MKNFSKITLSVLVAASAALTSCNNDDDPAPVKASIYERLGGTKMVADPDNSGQMIEQGRFSFSKLVNSTN
jgi:hypothetical protein